MQPHEYWQRLHPPGAFPTGVVEAGFAVELAGGRQLVLPVRMLADGRHGLASLIINQASFEVQDQLAEDLAQRLSPFEPEVVVGLPTLGLTLASAVAQKLGHTRYVPFGTSRKFWYLPELSVTLSSVTTPDQQKSLHIDPRMPPLLRGRRIALVDDVISSGASMRAGVALLQRIGVEPTVIGAAMLQSSRWRAVLEPRLQDRIAAVFSTPMLVRGEDGRAGADRRRRKSPRRLNRQSGNGWRIEAVHRRTGRLSGRYTFRPVSRLVADFSASKTSTPCATAGCAERRRPPLQRVSRCVTRAVRFP